MNFLIFRPDTRSYINWRNGLGSEELEELNSEYFLHKRKKYCKIFHIMRLLLVILFCCFTELSNTSMFDDFKPNKSLHIVNHYVPSWENVEVESSKMHVLGKGWNHLTFWRVPVGFKMGIQYLFPGTI